MDANLPYQYQSQIIAADRRKQLAEALQKQALGFSGAEGRGRIMPKTSPLTWIANTATGYLASEGANKAVEKQAGVRQEADKARQAEMLALLQAPEDQQQTMGVQGKFPETGALAQSLARQRQEKIKSVAELLKLRDPGKALQTTMTGQLPGGDYQLPGIRKPEEGTLADGTAYIRDFNEKDEGTTRLVRKPIQINNQLPGNEAAMGIGILDEGLKTRTASAEAAKNVLSASARAVDALEKGAFAGGGEGIKQKVRSALQAFGVTAPGTAETGQLQMALETAILSEAAKIKPISNTDIETLRGIVGSISTDPTALTKALAFGQALAYRGLMDFNDYLSAQGETVQNPVAKQRLAGAGIGFELPKSLRGPMSFQMEVLRNLQLSGGDISRFQDATGQRVPADATFNINPTSGFPAVSTAPAVPKPAASVPPPANGKAYTIEEFQRYFGAKP